MHSCLCAPEQLRNVKERGNTDLIASDFNTSAYRERGKAKMRSKDEAWEETLLIPPPDVVPMWCKMEDLGDRCGFIRTNKKT